MSPAIALAGNIVLPALGSLAKPSRVEELPMSGPYKYEGQPADLQPVFWASLGTQKIPIKPPVFGKEEHGQNVSYLE